MLIDKDELKNSLEVDQVFDFVEQLAGEPRMIEGGFVARTICHNRPGEGSHKLYYYENSRLFKCYTSCGDTFDIFDLVKRIKAQQGQEWNLYKCAKYVALYFGYDINENGLEENDALKADFDYIKRTKEKIQLEIEKTLQKDLNLKVYDINILKHLPELEIPLWNNEGINQLIIHNRHIKYDPLSQGIVIPHYDINNQLVGIRERTLIKEEEAYGKYRPAIIAGQMYNHPLSFTLYNINWAAPNIKKLQKAIIFESEKSCLKMASYFGESADISVAVCGSNLIKHQAQILLNLGVKEFIIAFDRQYKEIGDNEFSKWTKKLEEISKKYSPYVTVSFIFDKEHNLGYKDSPIDCGKEIFLKLFNERFTL